MTFRTWLAELHFARDLNRLQNGRPRSPRRKHASSPRLRFEPLEGRVLLSTFTVTNTLDGGANSFRDAIAHVNADPGSATGKIRSAIPGTGPFVIQPLTPLPAITHPTVIDGYSQGGAHADTLAVGDNAVIMIQLDRILANGLDPLVISAGGARSRACRSPTPPQ